MDDFYAWARAAGIRAVRTAAQVALSMLTIGQLAGDVDWGAVASVALVAAVYSLLTSVAGIPEVAGGASPLSGDGGGE